ncbi:unnamed protein product [Miscanthus lutarioriparius]|uniref:Uncharacterized protein n=1 Tax=Miscanthus lutarioriparius TaxID=422564 RepID=A0A811NCN1_9POAL|nr:unnamed protein product [Miscanthus lutarioriparius]
MARARTEDGDDCIVADLHPQGEFAEDKARGHVVLSCGAEDGAQGSTSIVLSSIASMSVLGYCSPSHGVCVVVLSVLTTCAPILPRPPYSAIPARAPSCAASPSRPSTTMPQPILSVAVTTFTAPPPPRCHWEKVVTGRDIVYRSRAKTPR